MNDYGICPRGLNVLIENSYIANCRHTIAGGTNEFLTTGLVYNKNTLLGFKNNVTVADNSTGVVDFHGNCNGIISNNTIKMMYSATAIYVRSSDILVDGNVIYAGNNNLQVTTSTAISLIENAVSNVVSNNICIGICGYGINIGSSLSTTNKTTKSIIICNNKFDQAKNALVFISSSINKFDSIIIDNNCTGDGGVFINDGACQIDTLRITNNTLHAGISNYSIGIILHAYTNSSLVANNYIYHHGVYGGLCIRYANDKNIFTGNYLKMSNTSAPIGTIGTPGTNIIDKNNIKDNNGVITMT